ncbi:conserved hypothetical protein [Streptomyces sp. C]|nr:conserved hypothetical protein [Streptomyces sp. C]
MPGRTRSTPHPHPEAADCSVLSAVDPRRGGAPTMDAFTAGLLQRIKATQSDLSKARETGDDYLADVEQAELEDLQRLAAEHGVPVSAA